MPVELTEEQRKVLGERAGSPVEMVDPDTQRSYFLLAREQYDRIRSLVETPAAAETEPTVPEGIRRSQEAFWRDLPELLRRRANHGRCVTYHADRRLGIAADEVDLLREILRQGIPRGQYYIGIIEQRDLPPWEPEEVEPIGPHHLVDSPALQ